MEAVAVWISELALRGFGLSVASSGGHDYSHVPLIGPTTSQLVPHHPIVVHFVLTRSLFAPLVFGFLVSMVNRRPDSLWR